MTQEQLAKALEESINAVSSVLRPLAPKVDTGGVELLALASVLTAYASLLGEELSPEQAKLFPELTGNVIKALKENT